MPLYTILEKEQKVNDQVVYDLIADGAVLLRNISYDTAKAKLKDIVQNTDTVTVVRPHSETGQLMEHFRVAGVEFELGTEKSEAFETAHEDEPQPEEWRDYIGVAGTPGKVGQGVPVGNDPDVQSDEARAGFGRFHHRPGPGGQEQPGQQGWRERRQQRRHPQGPQAPTPAQTFGEEENDEDANETEDVANQTGNADQLASAREARSRKEADLKLAQVKKDEQAKAQKVEAKETSVQGDQAVKPNETPGQGSKAAPDKKK